MDENPTEDSSAKVRSVGSGSIWMGNVKQ